jgi:hypothetical protein
MGRSKAMTTDVQHKGKTFVVHSDRHIERVDWYCPKYAASYARRVTLNPDSKLAAEVRALAFK